MAITDKKKGVWGLDQTYNKLNQGSIWEFSGQPGLWMIGSNNYGHLGQNNNTNYSSPIQIPGTTWSTDLGKIAGSGDNRSLAGAIKTDGTLWTWGKNTDGLLGLNDKTSRSSPTQIPGTWNTVSTSYEMFGAIKTDGTLWTWGLASDGQLGHNKGGAGWQGNPPLSSPKQVPGSWANIVMAKRALAVKTDGTLWAWGDGGGVLCQPTNVRRSSPCQIGSDTTWDGAAGKIALSESGGSAMAIKTDGTLWGWGGSSGTPLNAPEVSYSSPIQVSSNTTWRYLSSFGNGNFMATKTDGTLWAWGSQADYGQLGQGDTNKRSSPCQIPGTTWHVPHGGRMFNLISKTDGTLWATGSPQRNAIGLNATGSANPGKTTVQCGGDGWIHARPSMYWVIGIGQH